MANENYNKEDNFEKLEDSLSRGEQFVEKNQKIILYVFLGLVVIIGGYFLYRNFIAAPKAKEAVNQLFEAQKYFERDSFYLALNGDNNAPGFKQIIEDYSSTPSGNLAHYYAGICYMHMAQFENAISELQKFSADDIMLNGLAKTNIGDAYMQLGKYKEAAASYSKAMSTTANDFSTPMILMKAGLAYEKSGNNKEAIAVYERIQNEFPQSAEARDIEKNITRLKLAK